VAGKQLLLSVDCEATASQMSNGNIPYSDLTQGYGYQFWHCRRRFRGAGVFGQLLVVSRSRRRSAMTGGILTSLDSMVSTMLWKTIASMRQ